MKYESFNDSLKLTGENIDYISEKIYSFLLSMKTGRENIIRIRLSLEEAILRFRDNFGEDTNIKVSLGTRWTQPFISLEVAGDAYNPSENADDDFGSWSDSLLSNIGLSPKYSYINGINALVLKLQRPRTNPALSLLYAILAGIIIGLLSLNLLPADI